MLLFRAAAAPTRADRGATIDVAGRTVAVDFVRNPRARRLTLRADPVAGVVRVSLPQRGSRREADRFVATHAGWIAARVAAWPVPLPFAPSAVVPFDGGTLVLDWAAGRPRGVRRDGDRLVAGGEAATLAGRVGRWLKTAAVADLAPATTALAATLGRTVAVTIGDPARRWGSCIGGETGDGRIRYSWRLILAPPAVRQSVVAHEVAHLVHANHGRDFWRLAAELTDSDLAAARAWLKANGAALHWVGREA